GTSQDAGADAPKGQKHLPHHAQAQHHRCPGQGLVRCEGRRSIDFQARGRQVSARGARANGGLAGAHCGQGGGAPRKGGPVSLDGCYGGKGRVRVGAILSKKSLIGLAGRHCSRKRGGTPPAVSGGRLRSLLPDYSTGDTASAVALACRSPSCIAPANVRYASDQAAFTSGVNAVPRPCSSVQSRAAPTAP